MRFFVNKYPIKYVVQVDRNDAASEYKDLEAGNIFTISGIMGAMLELKPVGDIGVETLAVDPTMLQVGFTETEDLMEGSPNKKPLKEI